MMGRGSGRAPKGDSMARTMKPSVYYTRTESIKAAIVRLSAIRLPSPEDIAEARSVMDRARGFGLGYDACKALESMISAYDRPNAGKVLTTGAKASKDAARLTLSSIFGAMK
jgi:hypothetical protein